MIEQIVKEINICLENECFLSALGMALTLPDICGKAEYPTDGVTKRYIKWTNEYISAYEKDDSPYGIDMPYLSGEVLYNLRNAILHHRETQAQSIMETTSKLFTVDSMSTSLIFVQSSPEQQKATTVKTMRSLTFSIAQLMIEENWDL